MASREDRIPPYNALRRFAAPLANALPRFTRSAPEGTVTHDGLDPAVAERVQSPFVQDTLLPLLGIDRAQFAPAESPPRGAPATAYAYVTQDRFGRPSDTVNMLPAGSALSGYALDGLLAHELAHVAHRKPFVSSLKRGIPRDAVAENPSARSHHENYAYAFADAQDLLRQAATTPRNEWIRRLDQAERMHPGTYATMQRLVQQPLFSRYAAYLPSPRTVQAARPIRVPDPL